MSHYAVLVVTKDYPDEGTLEEALAPYDEGLAVDNYVDVPAEKVEEFLRNTAHGSVADDATFEELREWGEQWYAFDPDGNITSTYNPDSKWDWWSVGGRWDGTLLLTDGSHATQAKVSELARGGNAAHREEARKEWEELTSENGKGLYKPQYYVDTYGDADGYAAATEPNVFRAVVTPDGTWDEPGAMGWFGVSYEEAGDWTEYLERYHRTLDSCGDCWATVVDCHI